MPIQQFASRLYSNFSVIFQPMSAKLGWYIGSISCIYPVNFQVRTPNAKLIVRHNTKCGQYYNLQMARYSLNNSSLHPTYFCNFVILWVYFTIPFGFSFFWHFWDITFQLLKLPPFWLWITDEGSVPEMRIWSILLIQSDLKWCIHLSSSLFLYFF